MADKQAIPPEWPPTAGRAKLVQKCISSGIGYGILEAPIQKTQPRHYLRLIIKNGTEQRTILISSDDEAEAYLKANFEDYEFLGHLSAVFSKKEKRIEAVINTAFQNEGTAIHRVLYPGVLQSIGLSQRQIEEDPPTLKLTRTANGDTVGITLGPMSRTTSLMLPTVFGMLQFTLAIEKTNITDHDEALNLLTKLSDSLFFEIDLNHNISFSLARNRKGIFLGETSKGLTRKKVEFPLYEYPHEPMALYAYARSAWGKPLLQYLAYYQVLEFFFPIFIEKEASRRLRNAIKDPRFQVDADKDITNLLNILGSARGKSLGNERTQLAATIAECVEEEELKAFLTSSTERKEFFSKKHKGICDHNINLRNPNVEAIKETTELVYAIRCRIVHTKTEGDQFDPGLLLPDSPQSDTLEGYVELVQYLARKVLVHSSRTLHL